VTVDEYNFRWAAILNRLGGSLAAPAGWAPHGNYHYCSGRLQVFVPHPEDLTEVERTLIIARAEKQYLSDPE
jgi:hypothetical protein